jgi:hypothetical protein
MVCMEREIVGRMQEGNRRDYCDPMLISPQLRIATEDRHPRWGHASSTPAKIRSPWVASLAVISCNPCQQCLKACSSMKFFWARYVNCRAVNPLCLQASLKVRERRSSGTFFVERIAALCRRLHTLPGLAVFILDLRNFAGPIVVVEHNIEERAVDV